MPSAPKGSAYLLSPSVMTNISHGSWTVNKKVAACLLGPYTLASYEKFAETPLAASDPIVASASAYGQPGGDYVVNELLVKFKSGTPAATKAAALANISG